MLSIQNADHFYGESHTLWDLNMNLHAGSRMCLMGRNGVGKSTLLKCSLGIENLHGGTMRFEEHDLRSTRAEDRARLGIAYVPQGREIFARLTVEENLQVGLGVQGRKARIPDLVFEIFPVLRSMLGRRGGDLSGGQQQQLAIGRALVLQPKLLILDEPTEGIQPNIVHEIGDIILRLNEELKLTVLLVEQKLPFARRIGKQFVILDKGRNVAAGDIEQLSDKLVAEHLAV